MLFQKIYFISSLHFIVIFTLKILKEESKNEINAKPEPILAVFPSKIITNKKGTQTRILNNTSGMALIITLLPEKKKYKFWD